MEAIIDLFRITCEMQLPIILCLLGGGSIAIAGDGGLRQWQINNKVNHQAHVPNSFFGLK